MESEEATALLVALQRYGAVKTSSEFPEALKDAMDCYCGFYRAGEKDGVYYYFIFCQEWAFRYRPETGWVMHRIE